MTDLKPCFRCGAPAREAGVWDYGIVYKCSNSMCPLSEVDCTLLEWQHRPAEDALNAELAQLRAEVERLRKEGE